MATSLALRLLGILVIVGRPLSQDSYIAFLPGSYTLAMIANQYETGFKILPPRLSEWQATHQTQDKDFFNIKKTKSAPNNIIQTPAHHLCVLRFLPLPVDSTSPLADPFLVSPDLVFKGCDR